MRAVARELRLQIVVRPERLDNLKLSEPFYFAVSRATIEPAEWVERGARHGQREEGRVVAMLSAHQAVPAPPHPVRHLAASPCAEYRFRQDAVRRIASYDKGDPSPEGRGPCPLWSAMHLPRLHSDDLRVQTGYSVDRADREPFEFDTSSSSWRMHWKASFEWWTSVYVEPIAACRVDREAQLAQHAAQELRDSAGRLGTSGVKQRHCAVSAPSLHAKVSTEVPV